MEAQKSSPDRLSTADRQFSENLRLYRSRCRLSQEALAEKMQELGWETYNQMTVSRTEKGLRAATLGEARSLAHILGVGTEQMVVEPMLVQLINGAFTLKRQLDQHVGAYAELLAAVEADIQAARSLLQDIDGEQGREKLDTETRNRLERTLRELGEWVEGGVEKFRSDAEDALYGQQTAAMEDVSEDEAPDASAS